MNPRDYSVLFTHRLHSHSTPSAQGQPQSEWEEVGDLWGGYSGDRYANTAQVLDTDSQTIGATIRIRNYVTIQPLDQLLDRNTRELWNVVTVRRGNNETILEVELEEVI